MGSSRWGYGAPIKPNPTLGVVLFAALILCSRLPPTGAQPITVLRNPVTEAQGENVTLRITVSGDVFVTAWYRGIVDPSNLILRRNPTTILSPPGPKYTFRETILPDYSLVIINATFNYSGEYTVSTTFTSADIDTKTVTLNVMEPVSKPFITSNKTNLVEYNDTVTLNCTASGTAVSYQWLKDNKSIATNGTFSFADNNRTLVISQIKRSDIGPYICIALNAVSNRSSDPLLLNISYGPETPNITIFPQQLLLIVGSNLTISCSAESSPASELTWLFNSFPLNQSGRQLFITALNQSCTGNYTCQAFNPVTKRYKDSTVGIRVWEPVSKPSITSNKTNLVEYDTVALNCSASGTEVSYQWFKDNKSIDTNGRFSYANSNGTLIISAIKRSDTGPYTCVALNAVSNRSSDPFPLNISYGPETPNISLTPKELIYSAGSNVTFLCSAESNPTADYQWFLNGVSLNQTGQQLVITGLTQNQTGNYTCKAINSVTNRSNESTIEVHVQERITNAAVTISTDNIVEYNGSVVLNCSVTGTPETIQWFKDDNVLSINSRIALTQNNQTLTISNVSRDDDGNYRCNASNPINFSASNPQRLTVYYGPDLPQITPSNGVQAQAGSEVTLKCNAASNPIPQYSWQLNETNVSSTAEYVINNISSADQGTYTCVVTNSRTNRNNSASINIIVTAGPGSNNPPGSGLSGGAIAGIVIGCICGCALIGGLVYFLVVKKGAARGNDKHSLNEIKSTAANNTSSVAKDGSVNQSYEGEVQYASPLFKPTKPVETTVLEPEDKTIYSQVNTAKL